jgi:Icc-related predicted phosphoesterase
MRLILLSDIHNQQHQLKMPDPEPGDVLMIAGDLTVNGSEFELISFNTWLSKLEYDHKLFIAGNHDRMFDKDAGLARQLLSAGAYLENSGVEIDGIKFWGSPMVPDLAGWPFARYRGDEIGRYWDMIPDDTQVLMTHSPPEGILDFYGGREAGDDRLADTVHRRLKDLKLHVFGHIHEGAGQAQRNGVLFVNAAQVGRGQNLNQPTIIDWEAL